MIHAYHDGQTNEADVATGRKQRASDGKAVLRGRYRYIHRFRHDAGICGGRLGEMGAMASGREGQGMKVRAANAGLSSGFGQRLTGRCTLCGS